MRRPETKIRYPFLVIPVTQSATLRSRKREMKFDPQKEIAKIPQNGPRLLGGTIPRHWLNPMPFSTRQPSEHFGESYDC
jgi:hypothetical protein